MLVNEQHHQGFEEHDGYRISSWNWDEK
jgi:hypothetical protein